MKQVVRAFVMAALLGPAVGARADEPQAQGYTFAPRPRRDSHPGRIHTARATGGDAF
jgi:hypothetical protein